MPEVKQELSSGCSMSTCLQAAVVCCRPLLAAVCLLFLKAAGVAFVPPGAPRREAEASSSSTGNKH